VNLCRHYAVFVIACVTGSKTQRRHFAKLLFWTGHGKTGENMDTKLNLVNGGIGGSSAEQQLAMIRPSLGQVQAIGLQERRARIDKAARLMREQDIAALILPAGTSLYYFTGLHWHPSERLVAAIITPDGAVSYVGPHFEESKLHQSFQVEGKLRTWHEHEDPALLTRQYLDDLGVLRQESGVIALDENAPFFIFDALRRIVPELQIVNGACITAPCRMHKSATEIALMQTAKHITLDVQRRAASILREGISATEVQDFIDKAHRAHGAAGSTFCIVSFGAATALPHGADGPQYLREGDMVLIDTGCKVQGYQSDITRSYVFGAATQKQRDIWELEKAAQAAAFEAAQLGVACEQVDLAARRVLEKAGLGPDYRLPGLPHRTGHGIGLDIHEWTYLVKGNKTPLAPGMCFSNEPMIVIENEFGIRLEDHFYMSEQGPKWFTGPSHAIDAPFGVIS
jgi:Xaa-Pro dipeptidase